MNNKGFTLIELLMSIALMAIISIIFMISISNTFGLSFDKSYEILKESIVNQVNEYVYECDNGLIDCRNDYVWKDNGESKTTSFSLNVLKKYSYFDEQDFINPVTNEDIGNCLFINVIKDKFSVVEINLDDSKCKK